MSKEVKLTGDPIKDVAISLTGAVFTPHDTRRANDILKQSIKTANGIIEVALATDNKKLIETLAKRAIRLKKQTQRAINKIEERLNEVTNNKEKIKYGVYLKVLETQRDHFNNCARELCGWVVEKNEQGRGC